MIGSYLFLLNLKIWLTLVSRRKGRLLYFLPVFYGAEINLWLGPNGELHWQILLKLDREPG